MPSSEERRAGDHPTLVRENDWCRVFVLASINRRTKFRHARNQHQVIQWQIQSIRDFFSHPPSIAEQVNLLVLFPVFSCRHFFPDNSFNSRTTFLVNRSLNTICIFFSNFGRM